MPVFITNGMPLSAARLDIERQMKALADAYCVRTGELLKEMIGFSQCDPEMREAFRRLSETETRIGQSP
jgi:hypothetical protein